MVIINDFDYAVFMDKTYHAIEKPINLYFDHIRTPYWTKKVMNGFIDPRGDKEPSQGSPDPELSNMFNAVLEDEINEEDYTPLNKIMDDEFLNKLCTYGGEGKKSE